MLAKCRVTTRDSGLIIHILSPSKKLVKLEAAGWKLLHIVCIQLHVLFPVNK